MPTTKKRSLPIPRWIQCNLARGRGWPAYLGMMLFSPSRSINQPRPCCRHRLCGFLELGCVVSNGCSHFDISSKAHWTSFLCLFALFSFISILCLLTPLSVCLASFAIAASSNRECVEVLLVRCSCMYIHEWFAIPISQAQQSAEDSVEQTASVSPRSSSLSDPFVFSWSVSRPIRFSQLAKRSRLKARAARRFALLVGCSSSEFLQSSWLFSPGSARHPSCPGFYASTASMAARPKDIQAREHAVSVS